MQANALELSAVIAEVQPMRYTPAGLPALNMRLEQESQVEEAGGSRTVKLAIKAIAFGTQAERIARLPVGSNWMFKGFLANAQRGKSVVFHIQDFFSH